MKILNFGSLNIDHVYRVRDFVRPGETISALGYARYRGGKGMNQSVALARAGAVVEHAGRIGKDGLFLKEYLEQNHVGCSRLVVEDGLPSGHAMIQVSDAGENCIVIFGGTNRDIPADQIRAAMEGMDPGDFLLLQNEISPMEPIFRLASEKGLRIFINPAPMNEEVLSLPLELAETLIVNETEGAALTGKKETDSPEEILYAAAEKYPRQNILMTLGASGSTYLAAGSRSMLRISAGKAEKVVDTTAAGDTFIGYFLASLANGDPVERAMRLASDASAICVSRPGAADSIPFRSECE